MTIKNVELKVNVEVEYDEEVDATEEELTKALEVLLTDTKIEIEQINMSRGIFKVNIDIK